MSTGSAATPLLKAAPEPDQIADRLEGGDWRGLELCLSPGHVADDAALAASDRGRAGTGWPAAAWRSPPRRP